MSGYKQGQCPVCPSSDAYTEWGNGTAKCFSCGYRPRDSVEATLQRLKSSHENEKKNWVSLPADYNHYIPPKALVWLQKYGITDKEMRKHRIGYSEEKSLLVFPVFFDAELLMWQGRYFGEDQDFRKWTTHGSKDVFYLPEEWEDDTIVVVEDIVSAIKVSRIINCTCLFGSAMPDRLLRRTQALFKRAKVWLDPDKKKESIEMAMAMIERGIPTTVVLTDRDPKEYPTADLREIILGDVQ